jgi:hemoglobin
MDDSSLYQRLGGYDAVTAVANDFLPRLTSDSSLGRFWEHRGEDGVRGEKELLISFLCSSAGSPGYYTGRDMRLTHKGMGINANDWSLFVEHLCSTLEKFEVPAREREELLAYIHSLQVAIVE